MPYWPSKPKSIKERRAALQAERERLLAQQLAYAELESQRAQRVAEARPELAAALVGLEEANARLHRARSALGEDAGGMGSLVRQQRLQERLADVDDELEELAT